MLTLKTRTRRYIAKMATAAAVTTIAIANFTSPASAAPAAWGGDYWTTPNTGQSSAGAFIQVTGTCGYGRFDFTIESQGFEYIQLAQVSSAGIEWGGLVAVPQQFKVKMPAGANAGIGYYVVGWDYTTSGWEPVTVETAFWHPDSGDTTFAC